MEAHQERCYKHVQDASFLVIGISDDLRECMGVSQFVTRPYGTIEQTREKWGIN